MQAWMLCYNYLMMNVFIILFFILFVADGYAISDTQVAQKKSPSQEPHFTSPVIIKSGEENEITKIDITTIPNINSLKIAVKGIKLGDKKEEVTKLLGHPDEINEMGIYFYKEASYPLFAIVFDNENNVRRIVLFPQFSKYVIGNTKKLLNHQIATDEELRYYFLEWKMIRLKHQRGELLLDI